MSAFQGLLKKDFAISKFWFLLWVAFLVLFLVIPLAIEIYLHEPMLMLPVAVVMLFIFHIFFLPGMLLQMLHLEGKTQLWLHNPQSSSTLFLSKLAVCSIYQLITQLFLTGIGLILYQFYKQQIFIETAALYKGIAVLNVGILAAAVYFSCWVMLYWTVYHSLGKYPTLKNWRWLVIVIMFLVYNTIASLLERMEFMKEVAQKWTIPVFMNTDLHYEQSGWKILLNAADIPVIILVSYVIKVVIFFTSFPPDLPKIVHLISH